MALSLARIPTKKIAHSESDDDQIIAERRRQKYSYDVFGRITSSRQSTGGQTYSLGYVYNLADLLIQQAYPSGRVVSNAYDSAGRVMGVSGSLSGVVTKYAGNCADAFHGNCSNPIQYAAHGPIALLPLGNGVTESWSFNNRLQATQMQAGSLLTLGFGYAPSQNNGNLASQTITRGSQSWSQTYSYDSLNRLGGQSSQGQYTGVQENAALLQTYGYDGNGNWYLNSFNVNQLPPPTNETPQTASWFLSTNQINGWAYDSAGNVTGITSAGGSTARAACASNVSPGTPMLRTACYDAENRMFSETDPIGNTATYSYDGDGRRVSKNVNGTVTTFVYDASGNLVAEYGGAPNPSTLYVSADPLGSTRLLSDASGNQKNCYDYLPFGGDIFAGTNGRPGCYPSAPTSGIQFTGKERDAETGLDFFSVRYMSSAQGRFTSPDPLVWQSWQNGDEDEQARFQAFISNPQNFNLYTYGLNNPLKYNDPTGLDVEIAITFVGDISDEEKKRIIAAVTSYYKSLSVGNVVVRDTADSSQDKRTFGQKLKDFFTKDYQSITVDLAHPNYWGNNKDEPGFVKAFNMARTGDPGDFFGDLRQSNPTQWSNIIAWRILHETIAHDFNIGSDLDQAGGIREYQKGTLVDQSYGRSRLGIPSLSPFDAVRMQDLLLPRKRTYGR